MGRTEISWADAVWNPVTGCSPIAAGCKHCYAAKMAKRLKGMGQKKYRNGFRVTCHTKCLEEPLRWRKPRRILVCSMADLFHDEVPDEFIDRVWNTMDYCRPQHAAFVQYPYHTFLVLTKRPKRACEFVQRWAEKKLYGDYVKSCPHIHIGFSASTQADLDAGSEYLLRTPAAVRFLSLEPLVGPIEYEFGPIGAETCHRGDAHRNGMCECISGVDWVIVGGESGPGARPMAPDWVRSIRDDCVAAGVPFFFKAWGEWKPGNSMFPDGRRVPPSRIHDWHPLFDGVRSERFSVCIGKKRAGRELDGRTWEELPATGDQ
jgi:protein gp37